jgi:hypothetical protein
LRTIPPSNPLYWSYTTREGIARWRAGLAAARAQAIFCEAVNRNPPFGPCKMYPLEGLKTCRWHTTPRILYGRDIRRLADVEEKIAAGVFKRQRDKEVALRERDALKRRILRLHWLLVDPYAIGSTITFANDADRRKCEAWLRKVGFGIDEPVSPVSGRPPSARCIDRSLRSAVRFLLNGSVSEEQAVEYIRRAHQKDRAYWKRREKIEAAIDNAA